MHQNLIDRESDLLQIDLPEADALLLVGSALRQPNLPKGDLDLLYLSRRLRGTSEKRRFTLKSGTVAELTGYNPESFLAACKNSQLLFLLYREKRKIETGFPLFCKNETLSKVRREIANLLPLNILYRLLEDGILLIDSTSGKEPLEQSRCYFKAIETLILTWSFIRCPLGPPKPKWYLIDARSQFPQTFKILMEDHAEELIDHIQIPTFLESQTFRQLKIGVKPSELHSLEFDTRTLLSSDMTREAAFPFLALCWQLRKLAQKNDHELLESLDRILAPKPEISQASLDKLKSMFETAREEFEHRETHLRPPRSIT